MSDLTNLIARVEAAEGGDRRCKCCGAPIQKVSCHTAAMHARRKFCSRGCASRYVQPRRIRSAEAQRELMRSRTKVRASTGCWEYQLGKTSHGYPQMTYRGQKHKGHRLAYELFVGPIPDHQHVLHKCDNRICINPDHLFLGDNASNTADRNRKGRQARGERVHTAKLTEDQVMLIRQRYAAGGVTQQELGVEYGVVPSKISHIVTGKSWRHLPLVCAEAVNG